MCNGAGTPVSPYVTLDSSNNTDVNSVYHDFRVFTNDSRPDWYFESMTLMRWNFRVGFVGYTPKEVKQMANSGRSVAIYNGLVYDLTDYINFPPSVSAPSGFQAPSGVDVNYMDSSVLDVFKFNAGTDVTKQLDKDVLARQKTCLRQRGSS